MYPIPRILPLEIEKQKTMKNDRCCCSSSSMALQPQVPQVGFAFCDFLFYPQQDSQSNVWGHGPFGARTHDDDRYDKKRNLLSGRINDRLSGQFQNNDLW